MSVLLRVEHDCFLKVKGIDFHDRGTVQSIANGQAELMTNDGVSASDHDISFCLFAQQVNMRASLLDLTPINPGYGGLAHPFVGKWVQVRQQKQGTLLQIMKGKEGFVRSHNPIQNTFVLDLGTMGYQTVHATAIWRR